MTSFQRIIKYLAMAFAMLLIVSIISGICGAIALLTGMKDKIHCKYDIEIRSKIGCYTMINRDLITS